MQTAFRLIQASRPLACVACGVLYGSDAPRVVSGTNFRSGAQEPDGRQFRTTQGAFQTHTWCISGAQLMV